MKIATFNVNSIRARLDMVLDWLKNARPDALCLQETKVQDESFPAEPFEQVGYNCVFKGQKAYNGVAIISPHNIENPSFGLGEEPSDPARLIRAEISGISIVNTYIPQGRFVESKEFGYKLDWFKRLKACFDSNFKPSDPLIWLGDLNVAPEPRDVFDPDSKKHHVCFHEDVRSALKDVMNWGFVDVFRKHCDEDGQYSFWDYRAKNTVEKNKGWRIDHIMATEKLAEKSSACYIDKQPRLREKPSDHTPVIAEFQL